MAGQETFIGPLPDRHLTANGSTHCSRTVRHVAFVKWFIEFGTRGAVRNARQMREARRNTEALIDRRLAQLVPARQQPAA